MTDDGRMRAWLGGSDQTHPRTFQAREGIWATFEDISRELTTPIDDLLNDAMERYARSRGHLSESHRVSDPLEETHTAESLEKQRAAAAYPGYGADAPAYPSAGPYSGPHSGGPPSPADAYTEDMLRTAARTTMPHRPGSRPVPPPPLGPPGRSGSFGQAPPPLPPPQGFAPPPSPASFAPPPPPSMRGRSFPPPLAPPSHPSNGPARGSVAPTTQRLPSSANMPVAQSVRPPPLVHTEPRELVLEYKGKSYAVDKDRYCIGRSKTQSDLRLDDPNVSRQHAVIERVGSAWYVVDLGSTNGVEIQGQRVARRALAHGDVIVITTHQIKCVLR